MNFWTDSSTVEHRYAETVVRLQCGPLVESVSTKGVVMRQGWKAISRLIAEHESGRAKVELVPAETGRSGKHFVASVDGVWMYERKYIKPFPTLTAALDAAENRLNQGAAKSG